MAIPEGGTFDITIYEGSPFTQTFELKEDDEVTPIDLTGYTARAEIRPRPGSETLLASFDTAVDGPAGEFTIELDLETVNSVGQNGEYDVFLDNGADDTRMVVQGKVTLDARVTV